MMRVKEFSKLSTDVQNDLLRSAYSGGYSSNYSEDENKILLDLKTIYGISTNRCKLIRSLTDDVDLLEYRYISGFDKNYDCIEYLRELLYNEGILLAKIPCKSSSYRRYSLNKEPLDTAKVYVTALKEGFTNTPSVYFTGSTPLYIVVKYSDKNNVCLGYLAYYLSPDNFSKSSDKFTLKKDKIFLLGFKKDLKDCLKNGFNDKLYKL